jgi:hypothetical protein
MSLFAMMQAANEEDGPKILPEAAIARLREVAAAYAAGCRFKVGDIVTPRASANIKGAGGPMIVVEVRTDIPRNFVAPDPHDVGSQAFGGRLDIRTISLRGDCIIAHWNESWQFEPYTGPGR